MSLPPWRAFQSRPLRARARSMVSLKSTSSSSSSLILFILTLSSPSFLFFFSTFFSPAEILCFRRSAPLFRFFPSGPSLFLSLFFLHYSTVCPRTLLSLSLPSLTALVSPRILTRKSEGQTKSQMYIHSRAYLHLSLSLPSLSLSARA